MRNEKKAISINADAGKGQIMRIQDMVLVIENTKGSETNMLMTVKEYKEAYRDICFPVTAEFRGKLNTLMTDAYEKAAAEVQEQIRGAGGRLSARAGLPGYGFADQVTRCRVFLDSEIPRQEKLLPHLRKSLSKGKHCQRKAVFPL